MEDKKEKIQAYIEERYDADTLARIYVDNVTNDKGEILAKIWESKGFQEVYDYKGVNLRKNRLRRK